MSSCYICHTALKKGEIAYHSDCAEELFGKSEAPVLEYGSADLERIAAEWMATHATVTGVQPKLSLHWQQTGNQPRLTIVGAMEGQYILKTPHEDFPHMPELEALCMNMARACGIQTVPFGLMPLHDGQLCYITRRIDRENGRKIAMEDMCQISDRMTEDKYRGSHEQIANHIVKHSKNSLLDAVRYFEVVLFSYLIGNTDMHLKNFSLYSPDGKGYELTPAYDLLSTQLLMPDDNEDLALTLDGRKKKLTRRNFENCMSRHLAPKAIENLFERVHRGMIGWIDLVLDSYIPNEMMQSLLELIDNKAERIGFEFDLHDERFEEE